MSIHAKPKHLIDSKTRPSIDDELERKGELSRETRASESSGNKSEQSPTLTSPQNLAKVLPIPAEEQQLWLYPGKANSEQNKSHHPDLLRNWEKMES